MVSLITAVIVTVFSTWLSGDANRSQALRQERRAAYAALLSSTTNCESNAILVKQTIEQASMFPVTAESRLQASSLVTICASQMNSAKAEILLVADDAAVVEATQRLLDATIAYIGGASFPGRPHDDTDHAYYVASQHFMLVARASAMRSRGLPSASANAIAIVLFLVVASSFWVQCQRLRTDTVHTGRLAFQRSRGGPGGRP